MSTHPANPNESNDLVTDESPGVGQNDGEQQEKSMLVVGVGASAGGVEALEELFALLQPGKQMAFVVVQHLSPKFDSLMPDLIARKTDLKVIQKVDGERLRPDCVYMLPPGKEIIVSNGEIVLKDRDEKELTRPIDYFLRSLAQDVGVGAAAVILSGTGSDGSNGVVDIHDAGGYVICQSQSSAKFNGMPMNAIDTGVVDAILDVHEIPEELELVRTKLDRAMLLAPPERVDNSDLEQIYRLLKNECDIDFMNYKPSMIQRRIDRRILLGNETSYKSYLERLNSDAVELDALYSDLLVGVTEFFRDEAGFKTFQEKAIPRIIEAGLRNKSIRGWVAPTSTGEEAYSLAMLIDEAIQRSGQRIDVKIFATDVHAKAVEHASKGVYRDDQIRNISEERLKNYFHERADGFHISRHLRKMVVFAKHDVIKDAPFTNLDFVSCRNLFIYLKPEVQHKLLSLFHFGLNVNCVLWLGSCETTSEMSAEFETLDEKWRLYSKRRDVRITNFKFDVAKKEAAPPEHGNVTNSLSLTQLIDTYDQLLDSYMPSALLVTEKREIAHVFGNINHYLKIQNGRPSNDVLDLLPDTLRVAVANGLQKSVNERTDVVYSGLTCEVHGEVRDIRITVKPIFNRRTQRVDRLITFEESKIATPSENPLELDPGEASSEWVRELERQLKETRESLNASISELRSANEELQSTNEELIASNEELQSTNEELHSVNEELYTVNAEHQRKISELTELTDDMENLLDSIQVDTIFLDRSMKIRKFTLGIAKTFRLIPGDIGRTIDSFRHDLNYTTLLEDIREVLTAEQSLEREVQDKSGGWYLTRILPYTSRGKVDGVLLTLIEITSLKTTQQQLAELSEIVEVSDDAIFRVNRNLIIKTWNRGAETIYGYSPEEIIGRHIDILSIEGQPNITRAVRASLSDDSPEYGHFDTAHLTNSGQQIFVSITVSPIYGLPAGEDKEPEGFSFVVRDRTIRKRAEDAVQQAVENRDRFLAMLSHEIRNPLAAISNANFLLEKERSPEGIAEAKSVISRHLKDLSAMLDDLLDVARITHNKLVVRPEVIDLTNLTQSILESVNDRVSTNRQVLRVNVAKGPIWINADQSRMQQAIVNLLLNASKYNTVGGEIQYNVERNSDEVIIAVADNGEGITESLKEDIFEIFVQAPQSIDRSSGGMGLGLPLVKTIVEAHQGTISVESDGIGLGSVFTIRLPLAQRPADVVIDVERNNVEGIKILVVEDNVSAKEMLVKLLEKEGLNVVSAENGVSALKVFGSETPDAALVDVGLPDLDGYELAREMRRLEKEVGKSRCILVATTGYGQSSDIEKALEAGFDLHSVKPINPYDVLDQIGAMLT